ncbi:sensor histidine kinase [Streptomyces sp. NBC_01803]|uniref:sensor histidine kinase n=1 Tax=Streptomyces sp. NBC_01803 TaxID=2975946 RepID=UPI002DD91A7A|nr:nitrate- and nitrite sensing domain-containing protein [Streptomyces sp. NBC_01803]WSA46169.1 nitrate- and nitrite sensing domain-containing protein [Streptomyces sp. NBC_01803]
MTGSSKRWLRAIARSRRHGSIRLSLVLLVVVPVCAMTALWGAGSAVLLDPWQRLSESRGDFRATEAVWNPLRQALQAERRQTLVWLATGDGREELETLRHETDAAIDGYGHADLNDLWPEVTGFPAASSELAGRLTELEAARTAIDGERLTRLDAFDAYTRAVEAANNLFQPLVRHADFGSELTEALFDLLSLIETGELLSQENALLGAATVTGTISTGEREALTSAVAVRRHLVERLIPQLPRDQQRLLEETFALDDGAALALLESAVISGATPAGSGADGELALPRLEPAWAQAPAAVGESFGRLALTRRAALTDQATHDEEGFLRRVLISSAIGLAGVIACGLVSFRITRSLLTRMSGLRRATLELAEQRLPELVDRLRRGEHVPEADRVPTLDFGSDELGRVAKAFGTAQRTAVAVALEQAELREGTRRMFLNMSRRTQVLLHRQLGVIDGMEHKTTDPGDLADLYAIDHLAARMRRNAESLTILSGATPGRRWHTAVPLSEILRGSVSEIENYTRVVLDGTADHAVIGPAVGDVIHLLAELIENGTMFSPPHTEVHVRPVPVAQGVAVEIEDRGLGMPPADLEAANHLLAAPPEFSLTTLGVDPRLGLIVVSHLARRHDITITLRPSSYKGLLAVVLLPNAILEEPVATVGIPHDDRAERHLASVPHGESGRHRRVLPAVPGGDPIERVDAAPPGPPPPAAGLPRRVRMTHLAPQLLDGPPAPRPAGAPGAPGAPGPGRPAEPGGPAGKTAADEAREAAEAERSAGQARAVLLALRRGTRRALDEPSPLGPPHPLSQPDSTRRPHDGDPSR